MTTSRGNSAEPPVTCVILNWNNWRDTVACLKALARTEYGNLQVVVVDNGSTNDSVRRIREAYPDGLLIETGKNLGFAGGNNAGIVLAAKEHADYIWLLNNDTEPAADALTELVKTAQANPRFGAVGSVLVYAHDPNTVQAWGGGKVNRWFGCSSLAVSPKPNQWFDYITAASVLVRRVAFEEVGLLDDRMFLYWEDVEFSCRLRSQGWRLGVAPSAVVRHKENASTAGNSALRDRYYTASGIRFLRAYSPVPCLSVLAFLCKRLAKRLFTGQRRRLASVIRGMQDYLEQERQRACDARAHLLPKV